MTNKEKSLSRMVNKTVEKIRNPNADPQENYLEPEKDEPSDTFLSADAKELEPVKPSLNEINERRHKQ
ncbi:hypothetical protein [Domibacillus robiginosus]|uniref:hypothetical protein n=1 Tax=Domibacillus robiginosus TaxID=1071054 RepID=UPI00067E43E9|nr:hypothetical protein [Domibacillus robiginosus]